MLINLCSFQPFSTYSFHKVRFSIVYTTLNIVSNLFFFTSSSHSFNAFFALLLVSLLKHGISTQDFSFLVPKSKSFFSSLILTRTSFTFHSFTNKASVNFICVAGAQLSIYRNIASTNCFTQD